MYIAVFCGKVLGLATANTHTSNMTHHNMNWSNHVEFSICIALRAVHSDVKHVCNGEGSCGFGFGNHQRRTGLSIAKTKHDLQAMDDVNHIGQQRAFSSSVTCRAQSHHRYQSRPATAAALVSKCQSFFCFRLHLVGENSFGICNTHLDIFCCLIRGEGIIGIQVRQYHRYLSDLPP